MQQQWGGKHDYAQEEDGFSPSAFDLDTEQAMRIAALFAEYDRNSDGVINLEELDALLSALGPNTGVQVS